MLDGHNPPRSMRWAHSPHAKAVMDYLPHIRTESTAFLEAALAGSMDTPVPACPDWTMVDLVGHLGVVQRHHGSHLWRGVTDPPTTERPEPPSEGLAEWFREGVDGLVATLADVGTGRPAWTFLRLAEPMTTAFWHRRMAMEAAIHRWDAQFARGHARGFDRSLALDGITEVLDAFVPGGGRKGAPQGTVRVSFSDDDATATYVHGDPDTATATLTGPVDDVWLALWGRIPMSDLAIDGDLDLAHSVTAGR